MPAVQGPPISVGIVGLGRSGWNIHAKALTKLPGHFAVTAVVDPSEERRAEAEQGCGAVAYEAFDDLLAHDGLDVIVVASPSTMHITQVCAALASARHVVCEKPMALTAADADRMIAAAETHGRILAPFQNRRYEPHFMKVREIIESGLLGRILQIRINWSHFTRRWDWQTLKARGGGSLNNHGAHLLDHALQLFGPSRPEIFVDLKRALTLGDAEDHVKLILHGRDAPTVEVEASSADAFPGERWHVMGTSGGLHGTTEELHWRWVDWATMPERKINEGPAEGRLYIHEELDWQEATWKVDSDAEMTSLSFYREFYEAIRYDRPMTVTPASVRRQVDVLERCHQMCEI